MRGGRYFWKRVGVEEVIRGVDEGTSWVFVFFSLRFLVGGLFFFYRV